MSDKSLARAYLLAKVSLTPTIAINLTLILAPTLTLTLTETQKYKIVSLSISYAEELVSRLTMKNFSMVRVRVGIRATVKVMQKNWFVWD
jgi:hypothetical protein